MLKTLRLACEDLHDLERLFSEDEVWVAIQQMPNNKTPGPDGFTGLFYKRCWHIMKVDIMHAVNAFWAQEYRSLYHLNEVFMVLIKKKEQPSQIHEYRPISLIHSFGSAATACAQTRAPSSEAGVSMKTSDRFS